MKRPLDEQRGEFGLYLYEVIFVTKEKNKL